MSWFAELYEMGEASRPEPPLLLKRWWPEEGLEFVSKDRPCLICREMREGVWTEAGICNRCRFGPVGPMRKRAGGSSG